MWFFFFSSRRRHTRYWRDWSSDVCSSDLCQANERLVLRSAAVREAFAALNVAGLKGDWTRGDAAVGALLRQHGREGVPLYLLYPAGGGPPALLPELLTEGVVLRALGAG